MNAIKVAVLVAGGAVLLLLPGCATSPEEAERRANAEADIDEIMSYELDPDEYGVARQCLSDHDFDNYRPLGDRHILFEGRRGKLWINTLRSRCRDLQRSDVLVVRQYTGSRMCDMDRFNVSDWFELRSLGSTAGSGTGAACMLGEFHPVTEAQVAEIEAVLESLDR